MHELLNIRQISKLPLPIRVNAIAAAKQSLNDLWTVADVVRAQTADFCSKPTVLSTLPVFYANLDLQFIPTPQMMESVMSNVSSPSHIDAALVSLMGVSQLAGLSAFQPFLENKHSSLCPDLWERVWPWIQFFDTYWDCIPGFSKSERRAVRLTHCSLVSTLQEHPRIAEIADTTPGLHSIFSRAWVTLLLDSKVDEDTKIATTSYLIPNVAMNMHVLPHIFDEVLDGADGNLERLALAFIEQLSILTTNKSNDVHLESTQMFSLGNVSGLLTVPAKAEQQWTSFLLKHGIVTRVVRALDCIFTVKHWQRVYKDIAGELMQYLLKLLLASRGYRWIAESLQAGLLRGIISWPLREASFTNFVLMFLGADISHIVPGKTAKGILPLALTSPSVIIEMRNALKDAQVLAKDPRFEVSDLFDSWQQMVDLAKTRGAVLDKWEAAGKPSSLACDNMSCGKIGGKNEFKQCSGCQCVHYCSGDCQTVDWNDGHRQDCDQLRMACAQYPEPLTTRERSFLRFLMHHDYLQLLPIVSCQELQILRQRPNEDQVTIFNYTDRSGVITHLDAAHEIDADPRLAIELPIQLWRAARSGGRMRVHLMDFLHGGGEATYRLFPLRVADAEFHAALKSMAKTRPLSSDVYEQAMHDEICIRSLVAKAVRSTAIH
ncbi:hypothetical protein R3P38DRAFT_2872589 [Favolaschia claudopus]|uniref:MYND-type domain-containing protein n=1 Tax=Favolaschia claudopus TaxID=2862362 RepID=A0AAW0DCK9_9AGAR